MVSIKDTGILKNIVEHCIRIEETIDNVSEEKFYQDKGLEDIVCFNILQIGELTKHLSNDFISNYPGMPWNKIMGMRDRIAHGYGTIKMDRVWATATIDIIPLHKYCLEVLDSNK